MFLQDLVLWFVCVCFPLFFITSSKADSFDKRSKALGQWTCQKPQNEAFYRRRLVVKMDINSSEVDRCIKSNLKTSKINSEPFEHKVHKVVQIQWQCCFLKISRQIFSWVGEVTSWSLPVAKLANLWQTRAWCGSYRSVRMLANKYISLRMKQDVLSCNSRTGICRWNNYLIISLHANALLGWPHHLIPVIWLPFGREESNLKDSIM